MPLSDADRELLRIAATPYRHAGNKEADMVDASGLTPTQAWQRVNMLIDGRDALEAEPVATHRLQRIRSARMASRFGQRSA